MLHDLTAAFNSVQKFPYALILPHIHYCIMAWGYKGIILLKIQKKAVRIIILSGYSTYSEPLCKQLNMLKIADQLR